MAAIFKRLLFIPMPLPSRRVSREAKFVRSSAFYHPQLKEFLLDVRRRARLRFARENPTGISAKHLRCGRRRWALGPARAGTVSVDWGRRFGLIRQAFGMPEIPRPGGESAGFGMTKFGEG